MPTYCGRPSGRSPRSLLATMPKSGCSDFAVEVGSATAGVLPVSTSIEPSLCDDIVWCSDRTTARRLATPLGLEREQLADVHARHGGADRAERPAVLGRGVRLGVVGLELARPAPHPEQDDRRVRRGAGAGAGGEEVAEGQPAEGQRPGPEEGAAADRTGAGTGHAKTPCGGRRDGRVRPGKCTTGAVRGEPPFRGRTPPWAAGRELPQLVIDQGQQVGGGAQSPPAAASNRRVTLAMAASIPDPPAAAMACLTIRPNVRESTVGREMTPVAGW